MTDLLTPEREAEIAAAVAAYEAHPDLGFACCTAHAVADHVPALLAEVQYLRGQRAADDEEYIQATAEIQRLKEERDGVRAERDQARRDAELQRAAYFHEAARLLEDVGRDDDAVNLLDNVANGISTHAEAPNDNRHRLYIDGKGNAWISVCSDECTEWVVPVQAEAAVEQDVRDVADETGSLREIGRCW